MNNTIIIGDTWSYLGKVALENVDLSKLKELGWKIESKLLSISNVEVAVFDCDWTDANDGSFYHKLVDTSEIKQGTYKFYIRVITPANEIITSDSSIVAFKNVGSA